MADIMKFHLYLVETIQIYKGGDLMIKRPKLFNEMETAEMVGRAVQTLRNDRFLRQGIPYVKLGRNIRYTLEDIIAYLDARKITFNSKR